jgi:hypothetical protein
MLKRRQPKQRLPQISPHALELFNELQTHPRGTEEWYAVHLALHRALECRPWQYPLDSKNAVEIWDALTDADERRQVEFAAAK